MKALTKEISNNDPCYCGNWGDYDDDLDPDFDVLLEEELLLPFCFPLVEDDDCCLLSPLFLFLFLLRRLRFLEAVLGVCTLDEIVFLLLIPLVAVSVPLS